MALVLFGDNATTRPAHEYQSVLSRNGRGAEREHSGCAVNGGVVSERCTVPIKALFRTYLMCTPEMARAITRRWISEVPSKIV